MNFISVSEVFREVKTKLLDAGYTLSSKFQVVTRTRRCYAAVLRPTSDEVTSEVCFERLVEHARLEWNSETDFGIRNM